MFDRRYGESRELLRRSIAADAELAESRNALGIAALEQSDFTAAADSLSAAIRIAPDWAYARHNLALVHIESGNYLAAEREYREAIRRAPYQPYLTYNLGFLLLRQNRRREAEQSFRQSADVFDALIARYSERSAAWLRDGKRDPAGRAAERVRILKLNAAEVHNMLGVVRQTQGKTTAAEREFLTAIAGNDALNSARFNLASLKMAQAKTNPAKPEFGEAVRLWEQALDRDAAHVPSRLRLAEAYALRGDLPAAIAQYKAALRYQPQSIVIRTALDEALGDLALSKGDRIAAGEHYRSAVKGISGTPAAKRLERKARQAGAR
jgi:tetratricopeptide (TPR) repeat protein